MVFLDSRAISVGFEAPGNRIQESWCQGGSVSLLEMAAKEARWLLVFVDAELVRLRMRSLPFDAVVAFVA